MVSILICDDDIVMLNRIKSVVEPVLADTETKAKIHAFSDAEQISDQILSACDIALLDIDFDKANYNGMDIARKLRSLRSDAVIIFVTNFIEYAPEGYEVQAFRYILKRDLNSDLKVVLPLALQQLNQETLSIQINGEIIKVPLDDILYLEVQQHNVTIVTRKLTSEQKQKEYNFYATLSDGRTPGTLWFFADSQKLSCKHEVSQKISMQRSNIVQWYDPSCWRKKLRRE